MNIRHTILLGLLSLSLPGFADNWPQFRGPAGDGRSSEKDLPTHWSETEGLAWQAELPGEGHSSPVVWENRVFLTSALPDTGERILIALDARSGRIVWQTTVTKAEREAMHRENSPASSTAATDGKHVVTSFQAGDRVQIACHDFSGKQLWSIQPLQFNGEHGYSYSPIFYNDLIIFDCRQEGEAATLAIEKSTGKIRWRAEPKRRRISHITPLIINDGKKQQLIVSGSDETRSYDPATGQEYWWCKGPSDVAVAGLSFGDGMVFTTAGYPVRSRMAVRVGGTGDVTESHIAWNFRRQAAYVPSPVYHQGHLYSIMDEGMLFCFDAKTGEIAWEHRLGGRHRASLLFADGNIYATNDRGETTIFAASPESFQPLATNTLPGLAYATPAISNSRIYIRAGKHLYRVGKD